MQTTEYKSGRGEELCLDKFEAVAEGVTKIKPFSAADSVVFNDLDIVSFQTAPKGGHVENAHCGMCFGRRCEVDLHANVYLVHAALKPDAAAGLQSGWLGKLSHAEYLDVKLSRRDFAAGWRRELDMVDAEIKSHLAEVERR
jgi:hypothetical protein